MGLSCDLPSIQYFSFLPQINQRRHSKIFRKSAYLRSFHPAPPIQDPSYGPKRGCFRHLIVLAMNSVHLNVSRDVRLPRTGESMFALLDVGKEEQNVAVKMPCPEL